MVFSLHIQTWLFCWLIHMFHFIFQFCEILKKIIRDQRSVLISAALGLALTLSMGIGPSTTLPCFLFTFTLWMASWIWKIVTKQWPGGMKLLTIEITQHDTYRTTCLKASVLYLLESPVVGTFNNTGYNVSK